MFISIKAKLNGNYSAPTEIVVNTDFIVYFECKKDEYFFMLPSGNGFFTDINNAKKIMAALRTNG